MGSEQNGSFSESILRKQIMKLDQFDMYPT